MILCKDKLSFSSYMVVYKKSGKSGKSGKNYSKNIDLSEKWLDEWNTDKNIDFIFGFIDTIGIIREVIDKVFYSQYYMHNIFSLLRKYDIKYKMFYKSRINIYLRSYISYASLLTKFRPLIKHQLLISLQEELEKMNDEMRKNGDLISEKRLDTYKTNKIKEKLVYKYNNRCQACKVIEKIHRSGNSNFQLCHIDGRLGGNNSYNNDVNHMLILCPNCHDTLDKGLDGDSNDIKNTIIYNYPIFKEKLLNKDITL